MLGIGSGGMLMGYLGSTPPCFLCSVQQWMFVGAGVLALMRMVCLSRFTLLLTAFVSLYQLSLQMEWVSTAPKLCDASFDGTQTKRSACKDKKVQFLGMPLPAYVMGISLMIMGLMGAASSSCKSSCSSPCRFRSGKDN